LLSDLGVEFWISLRVAAVLLAELWVCGWFGAVTPALLPVRAVCIGVAFCGVRWILYFSRGALPFTYNDSTNFAVSVILILLLTPLLMLTTRRPARIPASEHSVR
jgi:hypothetical protein